MCDFYNSHDPCRCYRNDIKIDRYAISSQHVPRPASTCNDEIKPPFNLSAMSNDEVNRFSRR